MSGAVRDSLESSVRGAERARVVESHTVSRICAEYGRVERTPGARAADTGRHRRRQHCLLRGQRQPAAAVQAR